MEILIETKKSYKKTIQMYYFRELKQIILLDNKSSILLYFRSFKTDPSTEWFNLKFFNIFLKLCPAQCPHLFNYK